MHASKTKSRTHKKKLALILGGGGMSTSYIVGALAALKKEYKIKPDIIIAASGSAGTASFFLSGQFASGVKKVWLKEILSTRFISGKGFFKKINIDFLIDEIFKKKVQLNVEKIKESKTFLAIPAVNAVTGKLHYFTNKEDLDWFEVLRAAKAIPIFYNKSVRVGTNWYHDSHLSAVPETHIAFAQKHGATHTISIHSTSEIVRKESSVFEFLWFRKTKSKEFRKNYHNIRKLHDKQSLHSVTIFPSQKPYANILDTKREDIVDTIDLGYHDAIHNQVLKEFISEFKSTK